MIPSACSAPRALGPLLPRLSPETSRRAEQRSILDFVMEDARDLQRRLNARDQDKLDQ